VIASVSAAALAGAQACAGAFSRAKPASSASTTAALGSQSSSEGLAQTPVDIVPPSRSGAAAAGSVGALEAPFSLWAFFEHLAALETSRTFSDVVITQFGDSHTAADIETAAIRGALQSRFGDGGRGYVAIGTPWKGYLQEGIRCGMSSDWSAERGSLARGKFVGDGLYGLSGIGLETRRSGARAWADISVHTARAELGYLEQPDGGSFDVLIDGIRVVRVATRGSQVQSAFRNFDMSESSAHQIEVRSVGDGPVRIFGLTLDRPQHGIVLDALGINGARVSTCLQWDESHWTEQVRRRNPALVIVAYGTNESTDENLSSLVYERQLVDLLGRITRAAPGASCMLLGPPDRAVQAGAGTWVSAPKLREIIAAQQRVAAAGKCAYYNQLEAMGGAGSAALWASEDPPRVQKDRVHLTREGYMQLGSAVASDVLRAYAGWKRERVLQAQSPAASVAPLLLRPSVPGPTQQPDGIALQ